MTNPPNSTEEAWRLPGLLAVSVCLVLCCCDLFAEAPPTQSSDVVVRVQIENESITPVTARFLARALADAKASDAECLVIELDTPGGLLESTQQIVHDILSSDIPVVVYVSPSGARAASAGLFITLSGHVAAMAPGARIGAAHPVQLGGLPIQPGAPPSEPREGDDSGRAPRSAMEEKLVNDTVAWARGLAELRGRNDEWAALAVSESRVMITSEAVRENVVDLEAKDLADLLEKIDGREVALLQDSMRLRTAEAQIRTVEMWWGEQFLAVISNPNVLIVLMMLGVYGMLFELYTPGWGVAGTVGVVCLVLAFFGMSVLPINYAGLALIILGLAMFVAEAQVTSFGALTVGGIVCLILGSLMLVDSPAGFMRVSLSVIAPLAVATGLVTVFLVSRIIAARRSRVLTGGEGLVEQDALAEEEFAPDQDGFRGQVLVHGERWQARCRAPVAQGQKVRIARRDGLMLQVEPKHSPEAVQGKHS